MFLAVIDSIYEDKFLFSTDRFINREKLFSNVINFYKNDTPLEPSKYQIGIHVISEIIYAAIHINHELFRYKVDLKILNNLAIKLSDLLNEEILDLRKTEKNRRISLEKYNFLTNIIKQNLFPVDISIRILGDSYVGKSTLTMLFFGLIGRSVKETINIPYNKKFSGKTVEFREYSDPDRWGYGPIDEDQYIFYVIDSSRIRINKLEYLHKFLFPSKTTPYIDIRKFRNKHTYLFSRSPKDRKVLIIANKQDLPGAKSPKEIEEISKLPTVGFSAIAPEAPEKLEEILNDFLKD
jgi:hypothetical protein